jgi:hypothetical protein
MSHLINLLIAFGLLAIVVLLIYLVDRVNQLERETRSYAKSISDNKNNSKKNNLGLMGRPLWDAMTGNVANGVDHETLKISKDRYPLLLQLHIESLFQEGQRDGKRGMSGEPSNPRKIQTPDGPIESWLPQATINAIYRCGLESVEATQESMLAIRKTLNEASNDLYQKTGVLPVPVQADLLMGPDQTSASTVASEIPQDANTQTQPAQVAAAAKANSDAANSSVQPPVA